MEGVKQRVTRPLGSVEMRGASLYANEMMSLVVHPILEALTALALEEKP